VLVGAALTQWPYERGCGAGLLAYLLAAGLVVVTGLWAAVASWRLHAAAAHVVALATVLWGFALAGHEALPRVGPAGGTPLAWRCAPGALTATPTTPSPSG
jgi:hypothetical protein